MVVKSINLQDHMENFQFFYQSQVQNKMSIYDLGGSKVGSRNSR